MAKFNSMKDFDKFIDEKLSRQTGTSGTKPANILEGLRSAIGNRKPPGEKVNG